MESQNTIAPWMESTSSEVKYSETISSVKRQEEENKLLFTIALKCKEEMEKNCLNIPLENYTERVAHYTGLSKDIVHKFISKDVKKFDTQKKYFELNIRIEILQYLAETYTKGKFLTYSKIFVWYKKNFTVLTFSQFHYMMSCSGFEEHKTNLGKEIIIEDPALTFERYLYLKNVNSFRKKLAPIYYIGECFFDSTFNFAKPQLISNDIDISLPGCNGYVFFHAVSKQGFLNGLFCSPATKQDFVRWVSHILIPMFSQPSIIVMDNNELHGSPVDTITKYHSKYDMLQYLRKRNIPCNEQLHKAELYELITKCSVKHNSYDIDEIMKAHGHYVLRLPANFHDLSLTHFLWKHMRASETNLFLNVELSQIKTALLERLSCLPQELWDSFHDALISTEENIMKVDSRLCKALEKYIIIT